MAKPRGYPRIGTGFWDAHPNEKVYASMMLIEGDHTYREIIETLKQEFGDLSGFNVCQMSKLKQKLRMAKK